ncbi:MAG: metallophosphoesterase [Clostridia bacterium]|nr:metallophosphoesterase [Clostridia bacterium]
MSKFAVIADPHYYSETLGTTGKAYERREASDQKMLAKSKGTVLAAFEEIINSDAEFLLIAGDLSNDGERCSHEEMRELLAEFKKHKPVYVITATHDWCCDGNPRRFDGDEIFNDVDTIPPEELHEFYRDYGLSDAISEFHTHQDKVSYVVRPCEGLTVFCLDDDQNGEGGSGYSDEHFEWITEQTYEAKKRGDVVFGMQHHHLHLTEFDRVINGRGSVEYRERLCKKIADIGFSLMFTGHSHMQHIRKIESDKGNPFYEVNVGSISGYPAPIVYCDANKDGIDLKTEHLKSFTYNGEEYTNDYLKEHATAMFTKVFAAARENEKERFSALVACLGINEQKANKIWIIAKPLLKWIDKLTVKKTARILNFISFGKAIDKKAAKEIGDVKVTDMIFSTFHSILDGSLVKHEEGSAYYIVFTQAMSFPLRLVKKLHVKKESLLRTLTHLKNAAPELMTGGPLDNNNYYIPFYDTLI